MKALARNSGSTDSFSPIPPQETVAASVSSASKEKKESLPAVQAHRTSSSRQEKIIQDELIDSFRKQDKGKGREVISSSPDVNESSFIKKAPPFPIPPRTSSIPKEQRRPPVPDRHSSVRELEQTTPTTRSSQRRNMPAPAAGGVADSKSGTSSSNRLSSLNNFLQAGKYNPLSRNFKRTTELQGSGTQPISTKSKPKYKTLGILKNGGISKDLNNALMGIMPVPYLNAEQRQQYLVEFKNGKLYWRGQPLDTTNASDGGTFPFAMDAYGRIFAGHSQEVIHHSSFFSGGPVAAVGRMRVRNGTLELLTDTSGHYMPPLDYTNQVLAELKEQGVNLDGVEKIFTGRTKKQLKKTMKAEGLQPHERMYPYEIKRKYY